jgi:hypothetical protein
MKDTETMTEPEATAFASALVSHLKSKSIWSTVTEVREPNLKFIKIEASIKVK